MWKRKELKNKAKKVLSKNYWTILIVCFIMSICTGEYGLSSATIEKNYESANISNTTQESMPTYEEDIDNENPDNIAEENYQKRIEEAINSSVNSMVKAQKYIYKIADGISEFIDNNTNKAVVLLIGGGLSFLFILFIADPLIVGEKRFFLKVRRSTKTKVSVLVSIFKKDQWINVAKGMLIKNLLMFIWFVVMIIGGTLIYVVNVPTIKSALGMSDVVNKIVTIFGTSIGIISIIAGIVMFAIKNYEYRMVPYLLAENPHLKIKELFKLTKQLMQKNKWRTFVLDLSFFPWYILSGITLGFAAVLYVNPYVEATRTELYSLLRKDAVKKKCEYYEKLVKPKAKKEEEVKEA